MFFFPGCAITLYHGTIRAHSSTPGFGCAHPASSHHLEAPNDTEKEDIDLLGIPHRIRVSDSLFAQPRLLPNFAS